jgi:hypothetical protein
LDARVLDAGEREQKLHVASWSGEGDGEQHWSLVDEIAWAGALRAARLTAASPIDARAPRD